MSIGSFARIYSALLRSRCRCGAIFTYCVVVVVTVVRCCCCSTHCSFSVVVLAVVTHPVFVYCWASQSHTNRTKPGSNAVPLSFSLCRDATTPRCLRKLTIPS